jgi:thiol-disulfide isomerase/thioredoxin
VLLDFWGTWCAPCLNELPRLKQLRERYSRDDLEIIGIMIEAASRRTLVSWLNRHRIDWPQVHERSYSGPLARAYGVSSLPATVLFRRDGALDAAGLRGERLARRVTELVAEGDR